MNNSDSKTTAHYRNGILVLLLITIVLIVHNIFGVNGYLALRRQRKQLQTLQQRISKIKQDNQELSKENHALKTDPAAIERLAREQMHLAKPGEKVYMDPNKPPASPPPSTGKETSPRH